MKQKDNQTPKQGHSANMLLYAVAPTPKLSTDAIALDGAVVSRGNGIGATSETKEDKSINAFKKLMNTLSDEKLDILINKINSHSFMERKYKSDRQVDVFCEKLDKIFEDGYPTKAQIIDAYHKSNPNSLKSLKRNDLNVLLIAKLKWNNEDVLIKPVFFSWHVGLQYKCMTGYSKDSIFCKARKEFIFPIQTEAAMFFVKIWYWMKEYAYMQIRYWIPYKIKRFIKRVVSKKEISDLPF